MRIVIIHIIIASLLVPDTSTLQMEKTGEAQISQMSQQEAISNRLMFFVNGRKVTEDNPDPVTTLLQYLRNKLRLTGSKLGCGEGGCGACTVMVSRYDPHTDSITFQKIIIPVNTIMLPYSVLVHHAYRYILSHYSVNACLAPLCSMHGLAVTTVEGIGSTKTGLHPVQERLALCHGSQCGFCTPGIVMSMYTLLRNNPHPSKEELEDNFDGNLCRCTGYRPIIQSFRSFTRMECSMGTGCCMNKTNSDSSCMNGASDPVNGVNGHEDKSNSTPLESISTMYDPSQEPIFPPELKNRHGVFNSQLCYSNGKVTWYRPVTMPQLYALKQKYPHAKMVVGSTEVGIEMKFRKMSYPVIIAVSNIRELLKMHTAQTGVIIGASVTLNSMEQFLRQTVKDFPEFKCRVFAAILKMLRLFAGQQIRNVASVGGNLMTASPISDLNPLFLAAGVQLTVGSKGKGTRMLKMDRTFFTGYRTTSIEPEEILLAIHIPFTEQDEYFYGYKQAHRKEDDISIVNAGMRVKLKGLEIIEIALAYGGMAPTTVMAERTMSTLVGCDWNDEMVDKAARELESDLPLLPGAPGGMVGYRRTLTTSLFFKFYLSVAKCLFEKGIHIKESVVSQTRSGVGDVERAVSEGVQVFEDVADNQCPYDAVGRSFVHMSALQQTTGEAVYVDDLPKHEGELFLSLVYSTKSHARLVSVDPSAALRMSGVVDYIDNKDIPGNRLWGAAQPNEEEIFASKIVTFVSAHGQIIGAIIASSQEQAQLAANTVDVAYEELKPIITIKEAEAENSIFDKVISLSRGDLHEGFRLSDHVLDGEIQIGSQEHFYLETLAAVARPCREDNIMEIYSTTQHPSQIQHIVAATLGVPANRIVSRVKRLGGGFGGKQSRPGSIVLPVAIAAHKLGRPVRCTLDRYDDMVIKGTRHAYVGRYTVGFTAAGKIMAYDASLLSNGGYSSDLSHDVMVKAVSHADNAYYIPNINVVGRICRTNIPSSTAFRGFGAPQAMFITESMMDKVADFLCVPVEQMNLYKEGQLTHYNQEVVDAHLQRLWSDCINQSQFEDRRRQVEQFNRENRWKKRGISVVPTKYGLSYEAPAKFLNQSSCLVTLYMDGSVLLAHCGVEMGQGLHTKIIQVASRALGVPASDIFINDTSTDKLPMTCATAASSGSDLNGGAVQNACEILRERLKPYRDENPKGTLKDWVEKAFYDRVPLSATGSFYTKNLDYDEVLNKGRFYNYFTTGVACSEVEIDCLTGDHQVLRTDIVMDVGRSLNPTIDIGQIEGAFVQGYGLFLLEQQKISPTGTILTRGPGTYKIPGFKNIPVKMNVTLLKESINERAVYSSKGIGEPPLFLSSSVFFAVKEAIKSARQDAGHGREFRLDSPATPERIRMSCADQFTNQFPPVEDGTYTPWFVDL